MAAGEQFPLLRTFYGTIYVPPEVWNEVSSGSKRIGRNEAENAKQAGWIIIRKPFRRDRIQSLAINLEAGETEALALALELPNSLLLVDDAQGRRAATILGLAFTGTLGVLLKGKAEHKIAALRPVLELMKRRANFWLSPRVHEEILKHVGGENAGVALRIV